MSTDTNSTARNWVSLFIAVCLVGINMRMTISGLGPLLEAISLDQGVSPATVGLLASIPLLAWAVVSPLAQGLAGHLGLDRAVTWSLLVLLIATVWRSLPGSPINLWLGTGLIGVALAIGNVLIPASIKRDFGKRVPLVLGVYSALLGVSGALGAAIVAPVANLDLGSETPGWRWALAATGVTIPIAIVVWAWVTRKPRVGKASAAQTNADLGSSDPASSETGPAPSEIGTLDRGGAPGPGPDPSTDRGATKRVWRDSVAWQISVYMGAQSWPFYVYANWLAPISLSRGSDEILAGNQVTFFHVFGVLGSLLSPFVSRGILRRYLPLLLPIMHIFGMAGVVFAPELLYVWLVVCGLASGASLSVALTFIAQRSATTVAAGAVSGMAQSIGYLIAALGPVLFGWLFGLSGNWWLPYLSVVFAGLLQLTAGVVLLRERMVFSKY